MILNWKELDLLISNLQLEKRFIQKIRQPDYYSLLFDLYKPGESRRLNISLTQGKTGMYFPENRITSNLKLQRFAQLLRSKLVGMKIKNCIQVGRERIIKITIAGGDETFFLYIILWGNISNAILCSKNHIILDSFYRRPKRGEVSGKFFNPDDEFKGKEYSDKDKYKVRDYPEDMSFAEFVGNEITTEISQSKLELYSEQAEKLYTARKASLLNRHEQAEKKHIEFSAYELLKQKGEILLADSYKIEKGINSYSAENYFDNNKKIEIEIDIKKTIQQNSENYFKRYKKAKTAVSRIKHEKTEIEISLHELETEYSVLLACTDEDLFKKFLKHEGNKVVKPEKADIPGLQFSSFGFRIMIGRNAKENDKLLRKYVKGNDYWLHTRDYPGGYVFIKYMSGKSVPLDVLLDAGNLALFYSKAKQNGKAEMFYTQVKYLRRAKHGILGTVIPTQEKNLSITMDEERLKRLLG